MGRLRRLARSEFQTDEATKLNEHLPAKDFKQCFGVFQSFSLEDPLHLLKERRAVTDMKSEPVSIRRALDEMEEVCCKHMLGMR